MALVAVIGMSLVPATTRASTPPDGTVPVATTVPAAEPTDPVPEPTPPESVAETSPDAPPETVPETPPESAVDTNPDSAPDSAPDTSVEAPVESSDPAPPTTDDDVIITPLGLPGLAKFASVADVSPGESFDYTFVASCSGLEDACVNAVMTDVVPEGLNVTDLPEAVPGLYDVAYDEATRTLTITFVDELASPPNPPGSIGLEDGSSLNIVLGVELPAESQLEDGDILSNTATLTADDNEPQNATAEVPVAVERVVTPVATKSWPGSSVAGVGTPSTMTLGVRNASSSAAEVDSLLVEDTTADVFDKFDVTGLGAVTFPAGADQLVVSTCTAAGSACDDPGAWTVSPPQGAAPFGFPAGVAPGDITGMRFAFSNSAGTELPYDPTGGSVAIDFELRDTLRSDGSDYQPTVRDDVTNCATPIATDPELGTVAGTDACVDHPVFPSQATMGLSKDFFSDTNGNFVGDGRAIIGQGSSVSALTTATNTSPFPVSTITITEPNPAAAAEYSKVDVTDVRFVFPTGATTATATVTCSGPPGTVLLDYSAADSPVTEADVCGASLVSSASVTFTGVGPGGEPLIAEDSTAQLGIHGTLNGTETLDDITNGPNAPGSSPGIENCVSGELTSTIDGIGSAAANTCDSLTLWEAYSDVSGVKSAQLPTILSGLPRLFTLSFTNGGTMPATNVVMADPIDPTSSPNPFDAVRLADLTVPAAPASVVEVYDPDAGAYVPYDAADTALLERARGIRVSVAEVAPGAGQTFEMTFNVLLRDDVDPELASFQNCAGVASDDQAFDGFCSQSITIGEHSSGAAIQKAIVPATSVHPQAGLPGTPLQYKLAMQNTGTLWLRELSTTDADPAFYDAIDLTGTVLVNYPPGADLVRVDACTGACGEGDWVDGAVVSSTSPGLPAGVDLADVRGVRVTFSATPVSTPTYPDGDEFRIQPGTNFPTSGPCTNTSVCVGFVPRAELRSEPGVPAPDVLTNTATGTFESRAEDGTPAGIPSTSATHELTEGTAQLQFSKTPDRTAGPGVPIPFVLRAENSGTGVIPDLQIVEPFPDGLVFTPNDPDVPYEIVYTLPAGAPEPPDVVFTQDTDPDTGDVTGLRWSFPGWDFVPGAVVAIEFQAQLAPGVVAGQQILNTAGATGNRPDFDCNLTGMPRPGEVDDDPAFGDGHYCTSAAQVTVQEGNAFQTRKWVAGDPSLGFLNTQTGAVVPLDDPACPQLAMGGQTFTRYPCVARVLPGQGFDFYLQLTNSGTNPATEVRVVDVFPHPGDTGVILTGSSRGTEWSEAPTLLTPVALTGQGSADIGYGTSTPACTTDLNRPPVDCPAGSFTPGYTTAATSFRAIISFEGDLLLPGASTGLRFRMAAPSNPAGASTNDVAWNSFAHTEFFQSGEQVAQLPPTEPIKVGVALVYGGLTIAKLLDDPTGEAAGLSFEIFYECSVTPESGAPPVVVAEGSVTLIGGEEAVIADVPAGAVCLEWEPDAQGLVSNAPSKDAALVVTIPVDGTVGQARAEIVNQVAPPPTTATPTTATPTTATPSTAAPPTEPPTTSDPSPPTTAVGPETPTTAVGDVGAGTGTLPSTGSDTANLVLVAALLLAGGFGLVTLIRRRRTT